MLDEVAVFVQSHFTDGLVLVVGSGLSAAEGIEGMGALEAHLDGASNELAGDDHTWWQAVQGALNAGAGLEQALHDHPPGESAESWVVLRTSELLLASERRIVSAVIKGDQELRLSQFLARVNVPPSGLPILTTNYDRLIELACEMLGLHVDTTTVGHYAGFFDHERSCMSSCRGLTLRGKLTVLDHFRRAVVLKPHGSLDWFRVNGEARRCAMEIEGERLIITPGLNKYKAGYASPFDKHRDIANDFINRARRFLVVGYGFNDDHLQTHLVRRIREGIPTLILNRTISAFVAEITDGSPSCLCLSASDGGTGTDARMKGRSETVSDRNLWDLGVMTGELLA